MSPPRDARGRFVAGPAMPKNWGIMMTDSRQAGKAMRCVPRRKQRKTAMTKRWAAVFATRAEAVKALAAIEPAPGWRYTVAEF